MSEDLKGLQVKRISWWELTLLSIFTTLTSGMLLASLLFVPSCSGGSMTRGTCRADGVSSPTCATRYDGRRHYVLSLTNTTVELITGTTLSCSWVSSQSWDDRAECEGVDALSSSQFAMPRANESGGTPCYFDSEAQSCTSGTTPQHCLFKIIFFVVSILLFIVWVYWCFSLSKRTNEASRLQREQLPSFLRVV
mmetsp:Transcript_88685/g.185381  ORF Transcript_88685/g.185381 Transcript_88685/m.185381 type:complete len:194 (+) Transcript_88685:78-659(+)